MDDDQESSDDHDLPDSKKGYKEGKGFVPKASQIKQASPKKTKQSKRDEKYEAKLRSNNTREIMASSLIPEEFK